MVDDGRWEVASAKPTVDRVLELPRMEDDSHKALAEGQEDERVSRRTTTATGEMGGRAGRGGGEPPLSADLPIRSMGGRASQVGGGLSARAARMLDDGHEA
jgi:hypothetical protein